MKQKSVRVWEKRVARASLIEFCVEVSPEVHHLLLMNASIIAKRARNKLDSSLL